MVFESDASNLVAGDTNGAIDLFLVDLDGNEVVFEAGDDYFGRMLQHEIEKVSPEEMQKRWDAMLGKCPSSEEAAK